MCGLAGVVRWAGVTSADRDARDAMSARQAHRGPDGASTWEAPQATWGHRRLVLRDAAGGQQPRTVGNLTAMFNGELYDLPRWWARLGLPDGASEIEVLLAAWRARGPACLDELEGMFAVAVWDAAEETLWLARDRLGVKPLWWARDGGALAFASEIGALRASGLVSRRVDLGAVVDVLAAPCFSGVDRVPWADVRPLLPGQVLRARAGEVTVSTWWRWPARGTASEVPVEALREALVTAVGRTLQADVPVGVLLSGGLDSSLIAALARPTAGRLAWSVRFEDDEAFDRGRSVISPSSDAPYARAVAEALGMDLREVAVPRAALRGLLDEVVASDEALPAWEQQLSQAALFRAVAADGVRAALVGDAADETHLGYRFLLDDAATADPGVIAGRFGGVPLRPAWRREEGARLRAAVPDAAWDSPADRLRATTALVVGRWLPRLLHNGDLHAMAHGVEARPPFADTALLALAAQLDPAVAWRGGVEKAHLRDAAAGWLPEAVRTRRKSALPKDPFAGDVWAGVVREVLAERHPVVEAVVDVGAMARLADAGAWDERGQAALFRLAGLGLWARRHDPLVDDPDPR